MSTDDCRKMAEIERLLTNLQPHIVQACYPGKAAFIDNYVDPALELARAALAQPQAPSVPAAWQLVPVEPTPKMVDATWNHTLDVDGGAESQNARNRRIYRAMLAAAPPVAQEGWTGTVAQEATEDDDHEKVAFYAMFGAAEKLTGHKPSHYDVWLMARGFMNANGRALAQEAAPADPMDWPLPCDVVVGHGTMRKGVRLGALVSRMKVLYEIATGQNADEVAGRSLEQRMAAPGLLQQAAAAQEAAGAVAPAAVDALRDLVALYDQRIPLRERPLAWDAARAALAAAPVGLDAKAATEQDAARYRWLRSADNDVAPLLKPNEIGWQMMVGGRLDAAIDAAMAAAPQAQAAPPATEVQP